MDERLPVRMDFLTERRGYTLVLMRDLLGDYVVLRRWYGLANRRGGQKQQVFMDPGLAWQEVRRIERMRERRGYRRGAVGG